MSERARELGVRIALGATTRDVMRMVMVEAFALAAAGAVLGVVGAVATTRLMAALQRGINSERVSTMTPAWHSPLALCSEAYTRQPVSRISRRTTGGQ